MTKPDVVFVSGFLSREDADALLERIRAESEFKQNQIMLYGWKNVPRLEAWYGPWDYPYAKGVVLKAAPMGASRLENTPLVSPLFLRRVSSSS
jgi:hypothetical protein